MGAAVEVVPGEFEYIVETGDTPSAIGLRFGLCTRDVLLSNPPQDPWLIPGQTIQVRRVTELPLRTYDCQFSL